MHSLNISLDLRLYDLLYPFIGNAVSWVISIVILVVKKRSVYATNELQNVVKESGFVMYNRS